MGYTEQFLFGLYPYVCLVVFVTATIYRLERQPYTWQASSSQIMRKRNFGWASNLFHIGILSIAGGHVVGLLVPPKIFQLLQVPDSAHQMMELVMGSIFGIASLVGLLALTYRRVIDRRVRVTGSSGDLGVALFLLFTLIVGMFTLGPSYETRDDGTYLHKLANWAQLVVILRPGDAVEHLVGIPPVYKVHMLAGMTVFLVFPFTRLVHVCSAPVGYLVRSYYQIVRSRPRPQGGGRRA